MRCFRWFGPRWVASCCRISAGGRPPLASWLFARRQEKRRNKKNESPRAPKQGGHARVVFSGVRHGEYSTGGGVETLPLQSELSTELFGTMSRSIAKTSCRRRLLLLWPLHNEQRSLGVMWLWSEDEGRPRKPVATGNGCRRPAGMR